MCTAPQRASASAFPPWLVISLLVALAGGMLLVYALLALFSPPTITPTPQEETYRTSLTSPRLPLSPIASSKPTLELSVVIPAYNETKRLGVMLKQAVEYLEGVELDKGEGGVKKGSYELLIVDDGSKDGTEELALRLAEEMSGDMKRGEIRVVRLDRNRGKGGAVRHGMLYAAGQRVLFADADGASYFPDLALLNASLDRILASPTSNGHGLVVGSRAHLVKTPAVVKRSFLRNLLMRLFHLYLSLLGISSIRDTQCGFKLLSRASAALLFSHLHSPRWIFDCELLILAFLAGVQVEEVGIRWEEVEGSKVDLVWDSINSVYDSPFVRAYSSALKERGVGLSEWIAFVDGLNVAMMGSPPLQVVDKVGMAVGFVQNHWFMLAGALIQTGAQAGQQVLSKSLTDNYLVHFNTTFFTPLGLVVRLCKTPAMVHLASSNASRSSAPPPPTMTKLAAATQKAHLVGLHLPIVRKIIARHSDPPSSTRPEEENEHHGEPLSYRQTAEFVSRGLIAELEYDVPPPEERGGMMGRMSEKAVRMRRETEGKLDRKKEGWRRELRELEDGKAEVREGGGEGRESESEESEESEEEVGGWVGSVSRSRAQELAGMDKDERKAVLRELEKREGKDAKKALKAASKGARKEEKRKAKDERKEEKREEKDERKGEKRERKLRMKVDIEDRKEALVGERLLWLVVLDADQVLAHR
ncbi:glycosyltransferase family 2 protein [Pseudohyphozyma bogoriensis]|nr:glycosyltransferase family 2 protein [Pseudohyphozyma bogoriensis]